MAVDKSKIFAIVFFAILTAIAGLFIFLFEAGYLTAPELSEKYFTEGAPKLATVKCPDGTAHTKGQPCPS